MAKIGQEARVIAFAKWSFRIKNEKCEKGAKNDCTSKIELLCAKSAPKRT